jgi:hypothetical protein
MEHQPQDVIDLLEAVRTELDCDRPEGAHLALLDYWANRGEGNGTPETDAQARALADEIPLEIVTIIPNDTITGTPWPWKPGMKVTNGWKLAPKNESDSHAY